VAVIHTNKKYFMKLTKLILAATLATLSFFRANAQSINGGFEQWDSVDNGMFTNHVPTGWFEFMNSICESESLPWSVTQSTDAHSGSYATQLKNIATSLNQTAMLMTNSSSQEGGMNNKIPVTSRYTRLEGYYKYSTLQPDTFSIMVLMTKGEDFIGMADYKQSVNVSNYTKFSIPIIYTSAAGIIPDSAVIIITAGSSENFREGSTLLLDDITFALNTGLNDTKDSFKADVSVYPNPASDYVNIAVKGATHGKVKVELVNIIGQTLIVEEVAPVNQQVNMKLNLNDAPKGVLFIKVSDESGSKGYRILNQ
jgi:hypothetical protein